MVAPWPTPLSIPQIDFVVITPDHPAPPGAWMALDWQDYLTFSQYLQEIKGKFVEYNNLLDYYTKEKGP